MGAWDVKRALGFGVEEREGVCEVGVSAILRKYVECV